MKNVLKEKLLSGEIAIGTMVTLAHPDVAEWLARLGYDWLFLDSEHEATSLETIQQMMQAMSGTSCTPIVRPPSNDPIRIKRILDIGAHGVIIPMVNTKEEAEKAVSACRYPPAGIRGFGPRRAGMFDPEYFVTANDEIMVIALIETSESIKNIDEIMSLDGIDVGFIGYADLSISMGFGLPAPWSNSDFLNTIKLVVDAAHKHGKVAGLHTDWGSGPKDVDWALDMGFKMLTVSDTDTFIIREARAALEKAKAGAEQLLHGR